MNRFSGCEFRATRIVGIYSGGGWLRRAHFGEQKGPTHPCGGRGKTFGYERGVLDFQGGDLGFSRSGSNPDFSRLIFARSFCFGFPVTVSMISEYSGIVSRANRL